MKLFCLALLVVFSGCASDIEPSGFLQDHSHLYRGEFFSQEYLSPVANLGKYSSVKVSRVDLSYLRNASSYDPSDLAEVAGAFNRHFEQGLLEAGFKVLPASQPPGSSTLVVRPALVSLGTPQRTLNLITSAVLWTPVTSGSAGFAAKLIDGETGRLIGEIAEKSTGGSGSAKSLAVGSYTKYTHAEAAFEVWGEDLAKMLKAQGMLSE